MSIYVHDGAEWSEINDLKRYVGGEWQSAELRRYTGSEWQLLWPCHFEYSAQYTMEAYAVFNYQGEKQVQSSYVRVGNSTGTAVNNCHDSLLFFPVEQMRQDMGSGSVVSASLTMTRRKYDSDLTSYITVGHALSGVDPTATDNIWSQEYTLLRSSHVSFSDGQTKTVSIDPSGVAALIDGTSDCLCLPTTDKYRYDTSGSGYFLPESIVLNVTYLS